MVITLRVDGLDQNIGITDIRLAIECVAPNIAQFGGDPTQIIFSGHSAGAGIGEEHLYVFQKKSDFRWANLCVSLARPARCRPNGRSILEPCFGRPWM
jgi:hypothetical protein